MNHEPILSGDTYGLAPSPATVTLGIIATVRRRCRVRSTLLLLMAITMSSFGFFLMGMPNSVHPVKPAVHAVNTVPIVQTPEPSLALPPPPSATPSPPVTTHIIKNHIPSQVLKEIPPVRDDEDGRGTKNESSVVARGPRFHLLIAAQKPSPNLCKTLLSAAALNYPSPLLVNYGSKGTDSETAADIVHKTYDFLNGAEAQGDDLILVIEEDTWFQLPAEFTITRFLQGTRDSDTMLLQKYGRKPRKIDLASGKIHIGVPRYHQRVLFGAQKECSNYVDDLACLSVPQSPLLNDLYGPKPDELPMVKYAAPQFLGSMMAIGRVADLRPIYARAKEMLDSNSNGLHDSQHILSQIFGKQEYVRSTRAKALKPSFQLFPWAAFKLGLADDPIPQTKTNPQDTTIKLGTNYEFGIGLDYMGSIFQGLHNSTDDVKFIAFEHPPPAAWPSAYPRPPFESYIMPPTDLNLTGLPLAVPATFSPALNLPVRPGLDIPPTENVKWEDVNLLTNIIIPSSSVPSVLSFRGSEGLQDDWWKEMWFQRYGRGLVRQYLRNAREGVAAKTGAGGEEKWWDFRLGKGGAWMDDGTWLPWNKVCGGFEDEVFGDGKGRFGGE